MNAETILNFWFNDLTPEQWWQKDPDLDRMITSRFTSVHHKASLGELADWRHTVSGCLAEIIILDQFSRNIFRNKPQSFAYDGMALILAQEAIRRGIPAQLPTVQRTFMYLPFMHSESMAIHHQALKLFSEPGLEYNLDFEKQHASIIERFGRYPHRNLILGRQSSKEEKLFLLEHPGF
ncbi:DUF924 family protein [Legionella shakespearei]|uniref:Transmembrane protein n=1 Tax=Legionella shakespearei DSM 23087 TaxID=1122169 RepID=A0A0W0YQJ2_9GAMM|nr:DUF924 family protein [Legionella shakespearei]KTD59186.1 hypothetical protein Lsha_1882 [Legionella shakespearei DSM 23087]